MSKRILLIGNKEILYNVFDLFKSKIVGVVTNTSCTDYFTNAVINKAAKNGLFVSNYNINDLYDKLCELNIDIIFSLQYQKLLNKNVINSFECINLHFGILPEYRGCNIIAWNILNREKHAGITIHKMTEKFDEGDIYVSKKIKLNSNIKADELYKRLTLLGTEQLIENWDLLIKNKINTSEQKNGGNYYHSNLLEFKQDKYINWHQFPEIVLAQYNAFYFPPYQYPTSKYLNHDVVFDGDANICNRNMPIGRLIQENDKIFVGLHDKKSLIISNNKKINFDNINLESSKFNVLERRINGRLTRF